MNLIQLHTDDWAWMRRRLLHSVQGLAGLALLASLLQCPLPGGDPTSGATAANASQPPTAPAVRQNVEPTRPGQRQPNPVPPVGWRRTSNGWEHVSSWPSARPSSARPSINELIVSQRAEEPAWVQALFRHLRGIPPLAFALFQLSAVALIAGACEVKRLAAGRPAAS